jgi:hypothetical protein
MREDFSFNQVVFLLVLTMVLTSGVVIVAMKVFTPVCETSQSAEQVTFGTEEVGVQLGEATPPPVVNETGLGPFCESSGGLCSTSSCAVEVLSETDVTNDCPIMQPYCCSAQ